MHTGSRAVFAFGVALAAGMLAISAAAAFTPKPVPVATARDVAVAKLDELADGVPLFVASDQLTTLARKAWDLRRVGPYQPMSGPKALTELPIWLVRSDGDVRAFIAIDPRNGCRLETLKVTRDSRVPPSIPVFHDVCHGSLYDLTGERAGGPTPWTLDELIVSVRGGLVYVDRAAVTPGRLAAR
jgi:Rieske Fe-S protein